MSSSPRLVVYGVGFVGQNSFGRRRNDFVDMPLSAESEAAMVAWEQTNPQGKHGGHEYSLEQSGLTESDSAEHFTSYIERYSEYLSP